MTVARPDFVPRALDDHVNGDRSGDAVLPRVLHIITGLGTGGAEASLARVIARTQHDVLHAVVSLTTMGTRGRELAALGVSVHALGIARGAIAPRALAALRSIARDFQPACVQGWMYHGNIAASLLAMSGASTGPVIWNVRHALDAWSTESRTRRAMIRGSALLARQPQHIVFNSHRSVTQHAVLGYPLAATSVIPNGVDTVRFAPDEAARTRLRAGLGIPASDFVVGMVARVDPLKDHETFLAAVAKHALADRDTWYLLAGTGTAPGESATLDENLDAIERSRPGLPLRVLRLGERRDVPDILRACDVITMTSRSEGMPNAVGEAMACGRPCVVTDVGDAARLVGDSGIVVPVGDAAAIADAWRALQTDPSERAERGRRAVERIRHSFSADAESAAYQALWRKVSNAAATDVTSIARAPKPSVLMVTTVSTTLRAFLLPQADRFRGLGWRVDALAAGADSDAAVKAHFDVTHGIAWARNPFSMKNLAALRRIRAVVQSGAYDLVHVHTPVAAFVTRFALRGITGPRVIYTAHGFHAHPGGSRLANAMFRWVERRAARRTDYLVVINEHDAELARRDGLCGESRLAQHPGIGVDVTHYRPLSRSDRASVRSTLGLSLSQPVVAVVSEFNRNKRQRDVVSALARLRDEGLTSLPVLLFIGEGRLRQSVEAQAKRAAVDTLVRFLGHRNDVASLVGCADALVLASEREGLPRCLLEAMAMEVPAIASYARGSVDLLKDERGWLYPVGDIDRLADRLRVVLADRDGARIRATRAAHWVRDVASLDHVLTQHEALYTAALHGVPIPEHPVTPAARRAGSVASLRSSAA